ncbi:hypothetical protein DL93DRAFT_1422191 [Clavulina sp. PMI_390]|nr:hypothetical protein DL93DRAFT_1422191 [Clavulina sp. PMI_390]
MKLLYALIGLVSVASPALAALATTTRYYDGQEGACGCGTTSGAFSWQLGISTGVYTAAASQVFFDTGGSSWCGAGCGTCYQLTNQGYSACSGCGTTAGANQTIIVMVTNLCPNNGNAQWCPVVGGTNQYGYSAHFDIMSEGLVDGSWDNPVVSYTQVACPSAAVADWETCVCDGASTTTKASSTTSTKASSTTSSAGSTGTGTVALYGQCGGIGWTGGTVCASGTCTYENAYYSQCL